MICKTMHHKINKYFEGINVSINKKIACKNRNEEKDMSLCFLFWC